MLKEIISNSFNLNINSEGVSPSLKEIVSNGFNITINKESIPEPPMEDLFKEIEIITQGTIHAGEYTRVAIKLKSRDDITGGKINTKINIPLGGSIRNIQWERGTVLTDYRPSTIELKSRTAEIDVTLNGITSTVEKIEGDYVTKSTIEQLDNEWNATFKEGYEEGIVSMNKDGITVTNSNSDTYTKIDSSSFSVNNNNGGTVAEFSANSIIPTIDGGYITANEIHAPNVATVTRQATTDYIRYKIDGDAGHDDNNGIDHPFRTIDRALQELEDVENRNIAFLISGNINSFKIYGLQGAGELKFYLENNCVVNGDIYVYGVANRLIINGNSPMATIKGKIYLRGCNNVEIGWLSFRSGNKSDFNVDVYRCSNVIVRMCDMGHLAAGGSCISASMTEGLWAYGNKGSSNIDNYIKTGGYAAIYLPREGTTSVPDYTKNLIYYASDGGTSRGWTGGTYTKTPSDGWNPEYTETQKTRTWEFNKIWSDETVEQWANRNELIQGYSTAYDTGCWTGYLQFSDNMAAIKSSIAGGKNLSGRLFVQRRTSSGAVTGTVCGYASDGTALPTYNVNRGDYVWITLSSSIIEKIKTGAITYFYFKNNNNNINTYMKFETIGKIEITYTN